MKYVFELLQDVQAKKTRAEKIAELKKHNDVWALKDILLGTFSDKYGFMLPKGEPPYTPCEGHNAPTNLRRVHKDFRFFIKGGPGDKMPNFKREQKFIGLIEGVHPEDAKLVISMINKQKPKGITEKIIEEAFPGLLAS